MSQEPSVKWGWTLCHMMRGRTRTTRSSDRDIIGDANLGSFREARGGDRS